jgi:hypothetical protein
MGNLIYIDNATLVTGTTATTSTQRFLVTKMNHILVGIPLYTFDYSFPNVDFIPETEIMVVNGTFTTSATSYSPGVAVAFTTGCRQETATATPGAFAIPTYKITEKLDSSMDTGLEFENATIVANLTSTGQFYIMEINGDRYGVPVYNYSSEFPFATTVPMSAINVDTLLNVTPTLNNETPAVSFAGSTNLNSKIKTYADLIRRIKMQLGWPIIQVEGCDEQIVDFIDQAIEWYTKYAGYTEEFLIFDSAQYKRGIGIKMDDVFSRLYCLNQIEPSLPNAAAAKVSEFGNEWQDYDLEDYRKVIDIWSFDEGAAGGGDFLFSMEYIFAQQTYFSYVLGNYGFDLVSWHILKDWIDTRERMFALKRRYYFNDRTQCLKLTPEPITGQRFVGIIGAYVEKPIKDLIMERWIYKYALALTKIQVGNVRGKFGAVQLFGGGTVSIEIGAQGLAEQEKLEAELMDGFGEVSQIKFFIG